MTWSRAFVYVFPNETKTPLIYTTPKEKGSDSLHICPLKRYNKLTVVKYSPCLAHQGLPLPSPPQGGQVCDNRFDERALQLQNAMRRP